ncbi:DAK2 domain-containing protein [Anaerobacillus isosaccharinicus]|uniref:DAK2 domain-containing protein n=1 Tax=Anaerobacillus isosaccharinicus TaxID=1532552 RepID=A0A1S2L6M4_9BACI|nr:DAK2 domain-containing protein [Anaerobacillus isosaccharinicus]MBA5587381.1 DAK2 domain-containing protein [Anaerobacillus isosaccharinicus]QOY34426.1 DAK2 domain-containing protein [Anaerobacillus isosaccharinicus]
MTVKSLEAEKLAQMFIEGANNLTQNVKLVDSLNVFPVPDGDTGTNMNLSITSGVKEVQKQLPEHVGKVAGAFAKGLLMGARGNSGVILSQLFRGFSKAVEGKATLNAQQFAEAFGAGVDMAYKAVMKPVEGTILTVAKDSAKKAQDAAKRSDDIIAIMEATLKEAKASLERTPDLLPVLKEVGVVDSGGKGLVIIYEGFLAVLKGEKIVDLVQTSVSMDDLVKVEHHNAQSHMSTEDIEFGYCTEVMVKFEQEKLDKYPFDETEFRNLLDAHGDSLLVVSDEDLLKIHIHAEQPGDVITHAQKYGSLLNVKIENMREQHTHLLEETKAVYEQKPVAKKPLAEFGIITVAMGDGIAKMFKSLGAGVVIEGGQTMNPSTEDFVKAISEVHAKKVIILPNNSNIIMAAEQAASVVEEEVVVVTSKTVPQGLAALLAFNPGSSLQMNAKDMKEALSAVKTGQVTFAVRDTSLDGIEIKKDDFMGIAEKKIVSSGPDRQTVTEKLLETMIDEDSEILTIIRGEDTTEAETEELVTFVEERFSDVEVEIYEGNQPLYSYIFSVE